MIKLSTL